MIAESVSIFVCLFGFRHKNKFCIIYIYIIGNISTAIQVDYDLYFSDPARSSASQVIPFFTGARKSLTVAMWVQYTQKDEAGIFFTLYGVR